MNQYILSSFVTGSGGGNKAAVVFDDKGLIPSQMLNISKINGFSETAFIDIKNSKQNEYTIRYFTPTEEVDICGHAALAAFYLLDKLGYIRHDDLIIHKSKANDLSILHQDGKFFIEMKSPKIIGYLSIDNILGITSLNYKDIIPNKRGDITIVSTGLKDAIIELASLNTLKDMKTYKDEMINLCKEKNIIGAHFVSRETIKNDADFSCRNFAPAVGIDEESATGTSNASWLYYYIKENNISPRIKAYKTEQGYFMNSPSNIYTMIKDKKIFVGGKVKLEEEKQIECKCFM